MPSSTSTFSSRKRPALQSSIQPSITSFFASSPAPTSGSVAWSTSAHTSPTEPPPSVKSGLLNVGMRVRKAVPEGLKSGTYKAQKFALATQHTVLPPRKNKREHEDDGAPASSVDARKEQPIGQPRPIAVPKSLTRKYHAAVPRGAMKQDIAMQDHCGGEDFEDAGFLQPVS